MRYQLPKGTHDILPGEVEEWQQAEALFRDICRAYSYDEIRTPVFEHAELFARAVGEETDIVSKEMYVFEDRAGRKMALRPEGTAGVIRAYIQHSLGAEEKSLVKLFYIAPNFRYERPQAGRYRQHHQVGAEAVGSLDPALDVELIGLARAFFERLGVTGSRVLLNSNGCPACRPAFRETLRTFLGDVLDELCPDCRRRTDVNPLRVLDCKRDECRELTEDAPRMVAHLCGECDEHFGAVKENLATLGIDFELDTRIVRGLDYYTKTAFEFRHDKLGAQDALMGGGRYDGLVEELGGKPTPGVGFGLGLERALLALHELGATARAASRSGVYVAALGAEAGAHALRLIEELRQAGLRADLDHFDRGLRAQMKQADKGGFAFAAILGEDELAAGQVTLRDLESGEQQSIARDSAVAEITRAN